MSYKFKYIRAFWHLHADDFCQGSLALMMQLMSEIELLPTLTSCCRKQISGLLRLQGASYIGVLNHQGAAHEVFPDHHLVLFLGLDAVTPPS